MDSSNSVKYLKVSQKQQCIAFFSASWPSQTSPHWRACLHTIDTFCVFILSVHSIEFPLLECRWHLLCLSILLVFRPSASIQKIWQLHTSLVSLPWSLKKEKNFRDHQTGKCLPLRPRGKLHEHFQSSLTVHYFFNVHYNIFVAITKYFGYLLIIMSINDNAILICNCDLCIKS